MGIKVGDRVILSIGSSAESIDKEVIAEITEILKDSNMARFTTVGEQICTGEVSLDKLSKSVTESENNLNMKPTSEQENKFYGLTSGEICKIEGIKTPGLSVDYVEGFNIRENANSRLFYIQSAEGNADVTLSEDDGIEIVKAFIKDILSIDNDSDNMMMLEDFEDLSGVYGCEFYVE